MIRSPFHALALFVACGLVFGALMAVGLFVSWAIAAAALAGAVAGSVVFTLERRPVVTVEEPEPEGLRRDEIVRRARAGAREEELDDD